LSAGIPVVIGVLCSWYDKLYSVVRWNNVISKQFAVTSGVRQGSCLSPAILNVFINIFIIELRKLSLGCYVCDMFLGCLLYADDIVLLSPSVTGLQKMLDKCYEISSSVSPMVLGGQLVEYCDHIKYLGIYLITGKYVKFDINPVKQSAACNSIFSHSHGTSEIALLTLQEAYSLSVLL